MFAKKINLSKFYNHKLFYDSIPNGEKTFGLDNICILKQNYIENKKILTQKVNIDFCSNDYDNVICNKQKVLIESKVHRWHFIGFAYWGNVSELFRVIYIDETEEIIEVTFADWSRPYAQDLLENTEGSFNIVEDVLNVESSGEKTHLVHFHDSIFESHNEKIVKEIVLPNNLLVHIFALTIEY